MAALRLTRLQIAGLFGAAALVTLTLVYGWSGLAAAFTQIGWGIALIVLVRLAQVLVAGLAWRLVLPARIVWWVCPMLRWVREAVNALAPVAQVGGEIVGVRLLTMFGIGGGVAAGSVLVDVLVQAATQLVFSLMGVALLLIAGERQMALLMSGGLVFLGLGVAGFFALQRWGGVAWLEKRIGAMAAARGWSVPGGIGGVSETLDLVHRRPARLVAAALIHMAIWIFGASEVWIGLHFLGLPASFAEALVIESLSHAARGALFVVPGGLGVQEGAIIALAGLYGVPPEMALALALAKRVPDIILGLPGLAIWQAVELRGVRGPQPAVEMRKP